MTSVSSPPEGLPPLPGFAQIAPARGPRTRRGSFLCHAVIATELRRGRTAISRLRADAPLSPRPTIASGEEPFVRGGDAARVRMSASAAGPVGGDVYVLDIHVGAGSTLLLRDVGATLVLPGPHGERSHWIIRLRVEDDATCIWIPEPVIAAENCSHVHVIEADLSPRARLLYREELVLGRHGEGPGSMSARLTVRRDGAPQVAQRLDIGPQAIGSAAPSVIGPHRAVGTVVVVDPDGAPEPVSATPSPASAVMRQDPSCVQLTAVGHSAPDLRRLLDDAMGLLGGTWGAPDGPGWSPVPR